MAGSGHLAAKLHPISGRQFGGAISKPSNSKPGETVQLTSAHALEGPALEDGDVLRQPSPLVCNGFGKFQHTPSIEKSRRVAHKGTMPIRPATPEDAAAIARLHRAARAAAMPWLPVVHTPAEDLAFFRDVVLPNETVLVAEDSADVAGFIAYAEDWLNHLYVAPDHWSRGIGADLLARAQAASDTLQLWTFQENHGARRFYARRGFAEAELTDGAHNEERTPDVRLVWHRAGDMS